MRPVFRKVLWLVISAVTLSPTYVALAANDNTEPGVAATREAGIDKQDDGEGQAAEGKKNAEAKKGGSAKGGVLTVHVRWSPDAKKSEVKDVPGAVLYLKAQPNRQRSTDSQGIAKFIDAPVGDTTLVVLIGGPEKPCLLPVKITEAPKTLDVHATPNDCVIGAQ